MINELKGKVQMLLVHYPETRNSDKELIIKYWYRYTNNLNSFAEAIREMPSTESITRARRKIQESNPELRAVPEVEEARSVLEMECQLEMTGFDDKGCTF